MKKICELCLGEIIESWPFLHFTKMADFEYIFVFCAFSPESFLT